MSFASSRVAFVGAGTPYALVFAFVAYHYQGHDMTSCCWLVVMGSEQNHGDFLRWTERLLHAHLAVVPAYLRFVWCLEGSFA